MNTILNDLVFSLENGTLTFKDVRYLLIRPDTIIDFQKAVEAQVGAEACAEMMMAGGITGGSRSAARYKEEFGLSDQEIVDFMCNMGGEIGWGHFSLRELDSEAHMLIVDVIGSPFAAAYGESKYSVCHLIRGVLAGLATGIFGVKVKSHETSCQSRGDDHCRFEIAGST